MFTPIPKHIFSLYCTEDAKKIASEKANGKCEKCGKVGPQGLIIAHHIFPINGLPRFFNLFNHPSNIQILCPSCHAKIHHNGRKPRGNPVKGYRAQNENRNHESI